MGSSDMIKDNILDPDGKGPNVMFVLNALDVLNHRSDIAAMRSKQLSFDPLYETGALTKSLVKALTIAGVPIAVVMSGLLVLFRRRSRKKRIQMMFQK